MTFLITHKQHSSLFTDLPTSNTKQTNSCCSAVTRPQMSCGWTLCSLWGRWTRVAYLHPLYWQQEGKVCTDLFHSVDMYIIWNSCREHLVSVELCDGRETFYCFSGGSGRITEGRQCATWRENSVHPAVMVCGLYRSFLTIMQLSDRKLVVYSCRKLNWLSGRKLLDRETWCYPWRLTGS